MFGRARPPDKDSDLSGPNFSLKEELPLPFGRAEVEIIEVDEAGLATPSVSARSSLNCVKTLCIQRSFPIPPVATKFNVFHRDADNSGWSALVTELDWYNDLPVNGWASITLFDEQNQPICIDENDVLYFMEHVTGSASQLGILVTICENGTLMSGANIANEQVDIGGNINYMFTRFIGDINKPWFCGQSSDNSPCNNVNFGANGDGPGTVRFYAPRSNIFINLPVVSPPTNLTWQRGPVVGMWHYEAHNQVRAQGGYTRNCPNPPTNNDYAIAGNTGWHGVVLTNRERWCYLHY